jgi:hypothetical protein
MMSRCEDVVNSLALVGVPSADSLEYASIFKEWSAEMCNTTEQTKPPTSQALNHVNSFSEGSGEISPRINFR